MTKDKELDKVQLLRGLKKDLPDLLPGEIAHAYDSNELFIGSFEGNKVFPSRDYVDGAIDEAKVYVNVKDFGAKGDGVTDDTEAFINAINSINNIGKIYVPKGVYIITSTLEINTYSELIITGDGMVGGSKLLYTGTGTMISFTNGGRLNLENIHLTGKMNDTSYDDGTVGVYTTGVLRFNSVRLSSFENLLHWGGGFYHTFLNCRFEQADKALYRFNCNNVFIMNPRALYLNGFMTSLGGNGPTTIIGGAFEKISGTIFSFEVGSTVNFISNYFECAIPDGDKNSYMFYGIEFLTMIGNTFQPQNIRRIVFDNGNLRHLISKGNMFQYQRENTPLEFVFFINKNNIKTFMSEDFFRDSATGITGDFTTKFCNHENFDVRSLRLKAHDGIKDRYLTNWIKPTLLNGWEEVSDVMYTIKEGFIYLKGSVSGVGATSNEVFQIPIGEGFDGFQRQVVVDNTGNTHITRILQNGDIRIETMGVNNINLSGVRYSIK